MILHHFTTLKALGISGPGEVDIGQCWPSAILPHAAAEDAAGDDRRRARGRLVRHLLGHQ